MCTLDLVHQVGGFTVSKGSDELGQVGMRISEWLGWDVDVVCFAACMDAREGSFQDGEGSRVEAAVVEELVELGWWVFFRKL